MYECWFYGVILFDSFLSLEKEVWRFLRTRPCETPSPIRSKQIERVQSRCFCTGRQGEKYQNSTHLVKSLNFQEPFQCQPGRGIIVLDNLYAAHGKDCFDKKKIWWTIRIFTWVSTSMYRSIQRNINQSLFLQKWNVFLRCAKLISGFHPEWDRLFPFALGIGTLQ